MGLDIYIEHKVKRDEFIEVAYWRNRRDIVELFSRVTGEKVDNDGEDHYPINFKQLLKMQEFLIEDFRNCTENNKRELYRIHGEVPESHVEFEDETYNFERDLEQIAKCITKMICTESEFVWFDASW